MFPPKKTEVPEKSFEHILAEARQALKEKAYTFSGVGNVLRGWVRRHTGRHRFLGPDDLKI